MWWWYHRCWKVSFVIFILICPWVSDLFPFSCENAGECVELDGDLIDIESDSDGGDTEGTCTDMEDAVDIENAVIENLGKDTP